jgi:5'-methylthioadenosine phosphorylase
VPRLGLIAGSALHDAELPEGDWRTLKRHEVAAGYELPHRIDHVATMRALADSGCDRVLALSSVGGLRPELAPGTLLVPDDFIALDAEPLSALEGPEAHRVPGFDPEWRGELLAALDAAGIDAISEGVYWQTRGPRLETPAEVRLIAAHADVVGMTVASECVIAGELGLRYATLCVVDNLANGVGERELTLAEIDRNRELNRSAVVATISAVLPSLATSA